MKKAFPTVSKTSPRPCSIAFGPVRETIENMRVYSRLFRCRKSGFDFIGQIKVEFQNVAINVEVFNANYFDCFDTSMKNVVLALEKILLAKLMSEKNLSERLRETVCALLKKKKLENESSSKLEIISDREIDLKGVFDQLNIEYFENKIKADIEWGKKANKKNLASLMFGSYDPEKKLIRIHPRLQQDFVPRSVLELTVYHEMCHQWAPMKRKKGMWVAHHPQFKEKEREYRFYKEARSWEKENWKKLMRPAGKKRIQSKADTPTEANEILEITTLAG